MSGFIDLLASLALIALSPLIGGAVIIGCYELYDYYFLKKVKNGVPPLSDKALANPGKIIISAKEVEEDGRTKSGKFREFEKLRRLFTREDTGNKSTRASRVLERTLQNEGRTAVQDGDTQSDDLVEQHIKRTQRHHAKGIELTRPTDV